MLAWLWPVFAKTCVACDDEGVVKKVCESAMTDLTCTFSVMPLGLLDHIFKSGIAYT